MGVAGAGRGGKEIEIVKEKGRKKEGKRKEKLSTVMKDMIEIVDWKKRQVPKGRGMLI